MPNFTFRASDEDERMFEEIMRQTGNTTKNKAILAACKQYLILKTKVQELDAELRQTKSTLNKTQASVDGFLTSLDELKSLRGKL
jgi:nitrate/TMAO reductase-like tetraheme cytochrome c subunit